MNIFITGGTGFIGRILIQRLTHDGHTVALLTRVLKKGRVLPDGAFFIEGNPTIPGTWQEKIGKYEVIINLAGASIFTRWNRKTKKDILESRIRSTNNIVEALSERKAMETHLFNASAIGYYGFRGDDVLDERSSLGDDFLAHVVSQWESSALNAQKYGIRVVLCRFGIVLGKHGGALAKMIPAFNHNLGSPFGTGRQWFSWIHEQDLANIFLFLLKKKEVDGPVNCAAPHPVRNRELTKVLGRVLQKETFMPAVPGFVLRLLIGEFANVLLNGQRVLPFKLIDKDFCFKFPYISEALQDILRP